MLHILIDLLINWIELSYSPHICWFINVKFILHGPFMQYTYWIWMQASLSVFRKCIFQIVLFIYFINVFNKYLIFFETWLVTTFFLVYWIMSDSLDKSPQQNEQLADNDEESSNFYLILILVTSKCLISYWLNDF